MLGGESGRLQRDEEEEEADETLLGRKKCTLTGSRGNYANYNNHIGFAKVAKLSTCWHNFFPVQRRGPKWWRS